MELSCLFLGTRALELVTGVFWWLSQLKYIAPQYLLFSFCKLLKVNIGVDILLKDEVLSIGGGSLDKFLAQKFMDFKKLLLYKNSENWIMFLQL